MVLALCAGVALSQAFRTVGAIMASPLQADFRLSAQALGIFSGAFHFAFGGAEKAPACFFAAICSSLQPTTSFRISSVSSPSEGERSMRAGEAES